MAEIETVLVGDFSHLETPTNFRKNGQKSTNTPYSASTVVETPIAGDDSPDTLRVRPISTEGKTTQEILKDLNTPPRQNKRKMLLSKMTAQFPSPIAPPSGVLSPAISEVTAPSAFKERSRGSAPPGASTILPSTNQASMRPNLLFREKETKKAIDLSTLRSRAATFRTPAAVLLPVTPEVEDEKKPVKLEARNLPDTPESQPGRIVPTTHIRDDESWCASSVCPFDCVDSDDGHSVPPPPDEEKPKEKKKRVLFGLFKKNPSLAQHTKVADFTQSEDDDIEPEAPFASLNDREEDLKVDKKGRFLKFLSKPPLISKPNVDEGVLGDTMANTIGNAAVVPNTEGNINRFVPEAREQGDVEEGETGERKFIESLDNNGIPNQYPVDEMPTQAPVSKSSNNLENDENTKDLGDLKSEKDIPDLDDTVAPSRSYEDDNAGESRKLTPQQRAEQTKRCAKRFLYYVFVPAVVLSIIILAGILVKRVTEREPSYVTTSQTVAPANRFDFGGEQTRSPGIHVPGFFDNTHPSCESAQLLASTSLTYDSMSDATWDNTLNACGDSLEFGFATWYSIEVKESTFLEASTCNAADFDTQITVMSGDCEGLSCVTFSDNECGDQSRATWYAEQGKSYFVVVSGYREAWGEYTLSVNPTTINDKCDASVSPVKMSSTTFGTTSGATTEELPSCGGVDTTKPGVWYEVSNVDGPLLVDVIGRGFNFEGQVSVYSGTCDTLSCLTGSQSGSASWDAVNDSTYHVYVNGMSVEGDFDLYLGRDNQESCSGASVLQPSNFAYISSTTSSRQQAVQSCGFDGRQHTAPGRWFSLMGTGNEFKVSTCNNGTDLDTEISLFTGTCDSLECIAGTGRALPCGEGGAVSWKTETGSMYFIYVSGRGARVGDFWLTVEEVELIGTMCTEPLALGAFSTRKFEGTTSAGSADSYEIEGPVGSARGVWYELIGTGNLVELSVCGGDSGFDARVTVATGDCSDQTFLGQSSKCGEDGDKVKFLSTIGQKYQVFVHGSDEESTGEYALAVKHFDELNDRCVLALPLETVSGVYSGSTKDAMISDAIDAANNFPSAPSALPTTAPSISVTVNPTRAPTLRPTGMPTSQPSSPPTEAPKKGAKPDNKGEKDKDKDKEKEDKTNKNNRRAQEIVDSCNFIPPTHGVWYNIDGSGGDIIVSTCSDDTDFDTVIDVFTGECGNLQCIASNDDGCGSQSLVRFASKVGVAYYIQVRGKSSSTVGDFSLSVTVRNPNFGV